MIIYEDLPGVFGNKGTKEKSCREQGNMKQFWGSQKKLLRKGGPTEIK